MREVLDGGGLEEVWRGWRWVRVEAVGVGVEELEVQLNDKMYGRLEEI